MAVLSTTHLSDSSVWFLGRSQATEEPQGALAGTVHEDPVRDRGGWRHRWIEGGARSAILVIPHRHGWLVQVPREDADVQHPPPDLATILAEARRDRVKWLLFDRDAEPDDGFEVYERL